MTIYVTKKTDAMELEKLLLEVSYSGERCIIQRADGVNVGIVPLEDIKVLEQVDGQGCSIFG